MNSIQRYMRLDRAATVALHGIRTQITRVLMAAAVTLAAAGPAAAADPAPPAIDPIRAAFFEDAALSLHFRSYLFDLSGNGDSNPAAWAAGGWIDYRTGWIGDMLQLGAVAYTSQPLWAPESRPGSLLLLPNQDGFTTLAQAYAALRYEGQLLTIGRQIVDQPEVNRHDNRMVPITFEGGSLGGDLGSLSYYAAFLTSTKTRGSDEFKNFGRVVGVDQDSPMYLAGLSSAQDEKLKLKTSLYVVPDVLISSYSDAQWMTGQEDGDHVKLTAQFMIQSGIGEELLTGPDFVSSMVGVLGEVKHSNVTLMAGYTANLTENDWQYPYGDWPGYTNMLIGLFARGTEQAVLLSAAYDFSGALEGLTLNAQAAFDTYIAAGRTSWIEYDLYADYSLSAVPNVPKWLEPVTLGARYGYLHTRDQEAKTDVSDETSVTPSSHEFRAIVNYEVKLHGGQL